MQNQRTFDRTFSFEFFPPKTPEGVAKLRATREQLASLQADYRELRTRVEAVDGRLDDSLPQIRTALTRIEDYLLKAKP